MKTQFIDIPTTYDTICDVFVAYPEEKGAFPAVLLYMDAFGPRDSLYEMAKTIAARGYYVLLPNLFYRVCRAPVVDVKFPAKAADMPELIRQITPLFHNFTPDVAVKDAVLYFEFLAKQRQVMPGKIGITGYCLGGALAIRTAAYYPDRIAAVASFHAASLATDAPDSPHLLVKKIKAELYIAHADNDMFNPPAQIERLKEALDKSGVRYEAELYQDAAHGFAMADLPAHNPEALKRHWEKLFPLLERNLGVRKAAV